MTSYTIVSLSLVRDEIARVHRTGCSDIAKDILGNVADTFEAADAADAVSQYIEGELEEMGYDASSVKVISCAKGRAA